MKKGKKKNKMMLDILLKKSNAKKRRHRGFDLIKIMLRSLVRLEILKNKSEFK